MSAAGKRRSWVRPLPAALAVLLSLALLQGLLVPKYGAEQPEGALIASYYKEEKDHDLLFLGDCEVYESFSPKVLWEDYGINSFIRGSPQQLIWQSYYLLEDTLRYETPDAVVFNVLAMQYDEPQREAYNRLTLDGMRPSFVKLRAILASMTEEENLLDYLFPILRYHSRWSQLTAADLRGLFGTESVSHNGYLMRVESREAQNIPKGRVLPDYNFGDRAWAYLEKLAALCRDRRIALVLVKAPSLYPYWYPQWEEQIEAFASEHGLLYINFLELNGETGLDYGTDTYDAGLHLNLSGAEKLSRWLGRTLQEQLGLEDRRGEAHLAQVWEGKIAAYNAERDARLTALTS